MVAPFTSDPLPATPVALSWRTGLAGCLAPIGIFGAGLFLYWARNPGAVTAHDMVGRSGGLVRFAALGDVGGVGWGFLLLALVMAWFAAQMLWRFAAPVAIQAGPRGIVMRGMFGGFVPWAEVESVRFSAGKPAAVEIRLLRGRPSLFTPFPKRFHRIAGLEVDDGEGDAFAAAAERFRRDAAR